MVVNVVAIVTPAPGKEARVEELLSVLTKSVQDKEPDVEKYMAYKTTSAEGVVEYVFIERYKDDATLESHMSTAYFQELGKVIEEEGLLAKGLNIMKLSPLSGFDGR